MTVTMQEKLTAEIIKVITAAGLEVTRQPQFANTGVLYAQRGFDTFLSVHYDFQDRYCGFRLGGTAVDKAPPEYRDRAPAQHAGRTEIEFSHVEYHRGDEVRAVLELIRDLLAPSGGGTAEPENEPGPDDLCYPRLVVADIRHGYVYTAAPAGLAFTDETAQAYADQRNAEPGDAGRPYQVFRLTPNTGSPAVAFIAQVASMTMDGEYEETGRRYEQRPGDAIDTLQTLIGRARAIKAGRP